MLNSEDTDDVLESEQEWDKQNTENDADAGEGHQAEADDDEDDLWIIEDPIPATDSGLGSSLDPRLTDSVAYNPFMPPSSSPHSFEAPIQDTHGPFCAALTEFA